MKARLIVAMAASLLLSCGAHGDEIKLLGSAALKAAYLELLPQFERETGHQVAAAWSSSRVIKKRIAAGEDADVVIVASILRGQLG
jgi:molybdate transport system substrate-binding protein